eukprot:4263689-Amphidinium_carterae.1
MPAEPDLSDARLGLSPAVQTWLHQTGWGFTRELSKAQACLRSMLDTLEAYPGESQVDRVKRCTQGILTAMRECARLRVLLHATAPGSTGQARAFGGQLDCADAPMPLKTYSLPLQHADVPPSFGRATTGGGKLESLARSLDHDPGQAKVALAYKQGASATHAVAVIH